jgi:hypothetical protein
MMKQSNVASADARIHGDGGSDVDVERYLHGSSIQPNGLNGVVVGLVLFLGPGYLEIDVRTMVRFEVLVISQRLILRLLYGLVDLVNIHRA